MSTVENNDENKLISPYVSPLKLKSKLDYVLQLAGVTDLDKASYWNIFEEISEIAKQLNENPTQRDLILWKYSLSLESRLDRFILEKIETAKKSYPSKKSNNERFNAKEALKNTIENTLSQDDVIFSHEEIRSFVDSLTQLLEDISLLPDYNRDDAYKNGEERVLSIFNRPGKSLSASA